MLREGRGGEGLPDGARVAAILWHRRVVHTAAIQGSQHRRGVVKEDMGRKKDTRLFGSLGFGGKMERWYW